MRECKDCAGLCCSICKVPITHKDLEKLKSEHISFEELIDWISISDFQSEYPDIRLDNGYFYMVLAKDERGDCVFASRNQHTLRCTIHGRHPILCKIYPFDPIHRSLRKNRVCNTLASYDKSIDAAYEEYHTNLVEFNRLIRDWNSLNQKDRSQKAFLRFLIR